jgi:GT2 family glycosyltransferase
MINVSIVLYKHTRDEINNLLKSLSDSPFVQDIFIVDNSPFRSEEFSDARYQYIFTGKNIGFGAAHNIAINQSISQHVAYHLVINPDIHFDSDILEKLMHYADNHPDTGHLMPKVLNPDGSVQYLCKLLPSPSDLFFRRFLSEKLTKQRMYKFEMRESGYNKIMEVPYLSGCFMFLRVKALEETGVFDERFFMYPEDIDLTRRIHLKYKTVFYPEVSVIHEHTRSSYKNFRMFSIHLINLIRYFNKWGWFSDTERKRINRNIEKQYK